MQAHPSVSELLGQMRARGASDLFLCAGARPALRVHGQMQPLELPVTSPELLSDFVDGLLQTPERRARFEEGGDADLGLTLGPERFRINLSRSRGALSLVARHVPAGNLELEALRLPEAVAGFADAQRGLVLVCGATGSGKSTTVAAMVNRINQGRRCHIVTIEDPIEFVHKSAVALVSQREVGPHSKSFRSALKAAVREDPDCILVGEMRDQETIEMALNAAETGVLVFGTLHTNSAAKTVDRIVNVFPVERQEMVRNVVGAVTKGILSQQLLRRKKGGRVAAIEVLFGSPAFTSLVREGKTHQITSLISQGRSRGMIGMDDSLRKLVDQDVIEPLAALEKALDKDQMRTWLQERGVETPEDVAGH